MRFTITRQNLHNGLAAVSASIPSKTTLPVLSNILFATDGDGVWMSGTDLDVAVRVRVPAEVAEPGSLTAPGRKLQEITRELPDPSIGDKVARWTALGRPGAPADIADIVALLVSDDAHWLTGATLPATGGLVTSTTNIINKG